MLHVYYTTPYYIDGSHVVEFLLAPTVTGNLVLGLSTIDYPPFLHFLDCFVFVIIHLMNSNGGRVSHKMAFGMYDWQHAQRALKFTLKVDKKYVKTISREILCSVGMGSQ